MNQWNTFRDQFPVCNELIYLNHAAVAPLPLCCTKSMQAYLQEMSRFGAFHYPGEAQDAIVETRQLGARLLNTQAERVFFVRSTSQGLGIAATGYPFREGDNLILVEQEFPANLRPWLPLRRKGVEVRLVPQRNGRVEIDDLVKAMDARTALLSMSFVQFLSGFRANLAAVSELCKQHDAMFVVDAIQGLGVFPLDVEALGIDFLSADSHKWLLGPEGVGLGFASDRIRERIEPALEGWLAVERPFDFFDLEQPLKSTAARYEEGAFNMAGVRGMRGSLELLIETGVDRLADRILELGDYLVEGLRSRDFTILSPRERREEKSGIVLASRDGEDCESLGQVLREAKIALSVRGGALRFSPHAYNTKDELDRLFEVLGSCRSF